VPYEGITWRIEGNPEDLAGNKRPNLSDRRHSSRASKTLLSVWGFFLERLCYYVRSHLNESKAFHCLCLYVRRHFWWYEDIYYLGAYVLSARRHLGNTKALLTLSTREPTILCFFGLLYILIFI
jgi:hypothetical protein